jgi:hypothetical protein
MAEHDSEKELEFLAYLDFLKALRDEKVFNLRIIDDHDKIFDYSKGHTITLAVPIEERYKFHVNLKIGYYIYKGNLADIDDIQLDWFCRKLTKISRFLNEGM